MKDPSALLGLVVSLASLCFLLLTVDLAELLAALRSADLVLLLACVVTVPVTMYLKAYRWRLFFPGSDGVSMRGLLAALYLGYMTNTIVPLRAGELVRAYLVGESEKVKKSKVLATVLIEKVCDLGTMAGLLFLLRFLTELPTWADAAAWASGVGLSMAGVGLSFALTTRQLTVRLVERLEAMVPRLKPLQLSAMVTSFLDGLAFVRDVRVLVSVLFWSAMLWAMSALTVYLGLWAVGIQASVATAVFVLVITNLGMAVPSLPGYVGVYHSAVVVALEPAGIDPSRSLAAAIVLHALIFGIFIVGGVYCLLRARQAERARLGLGSLVDRARSSHGFGMLGDRSSR